MQPQPRALYRIIKAQAALACGLQLVGRHARAIRLRDLAFDDGYWEAEALNSANQYVELRIEPTTGKVVREKLER